MDNKFTMTVTQNIFVAKRNIVDYLWKSANLEGIAVTYPETEAIYNGLMVQGVKLEDAIAINNLKHAWQFIIDYVDYRLDYPLVCKINQIVGGNNIVMNAGYLRKNDVSIGGTRWRPAIPDEAKVITDLSEISAIPNPTDRAITLMLYLMRDQLFLDGNKRTGMLAANQIMIAHGVGIIAVPIEQQPQFLGMLIQYYESDDMSALKAFVYENCIDGIVFEQELEMPKPIELKPKKPEAR